MVTASHLIEVEIKKKPLLQEAIMQGIISYAALAEKLHPKIQKELNKKISLSAVVMALRRHSEKLKKNFIKKSKFNFDTEIIMKTHLIDFCFLKSNEIFSKLKKIYTLIDYEKGDTFNVINGNYEVSIVASNKYYKKIKDVLKEEKLLNIEKNLVSLTLNLSKDFISTPGTIFEITRKLAWENVNIIEIVSTMTELTFIVEKKKATDAYNALQELIEEKRL